MRRGRALDSLLVAALFPSCGGGVPPPDRELSELERLAFIPSAECDLPGGGDFGIERPIVIDLFEITRRDFELLTKQHPGEVWLARRFAWEEEIPGNVDPGDWPAFFTFDEALRLAAWRGMRLPTAREWVHVAVGRRGLKYPWGVDQESVANTIETGLGRLSAVGTYENGRCQPFGCYDLVGNVWEWVNGYVPGYDDQDGLLYRERQIRDLTREDDRDGASSTQIGPRELLVSLMGGAYDSARRPTFVYNDKDVYTFRFHSRLVDPRTLSPTIGARMCADAEPYLWAASSHWGTGPEVRARVRAVAIRWSKDPLARAELRGLLGRLLEREGAPAALRWLFEGSDGADLPE